jgi:hypothetical protein
MKKRCLSCGVQFTLSGSGKRQKYCPKCARRGDGRGRGLPASKPLKTNGAEKHFWTPIPHDARSPIHFTTPEGDKGRIWISDRNDRRAKSFIGESISLRPRGWQRGRAASVSRGKRRQTSFVSRATHTSISRDLSPILQPVIPAVSYPTFGLDRGATRSSSTSRPRRSFKSWAVASARSSWSSMATRSMSTTMAAWQP